MHNGSALQKLRCTQTIHLGKFPFFFIDLCCERCNTFFVWENTNSATNQNSFFFETNQRQQQHPNCFNVWNYLCLKFPIRSLCSYFPRQLPVWLFHAFGFAFCHCPRVHRRSLCNPHSENHTALTTAALGAQRGKEREREREREKE